MTEQHSICSVCAWRATCQKKFSLSGRDIKCSDFTRDITIKSEETEAETPEERKTQNK